jgi:hypothetical protein
MVFLFSVRIIQCIFCSDAGNVFQVFRSRYTTANKQSITIIQQTAPSMSLYRKREAYYNRRHRGIRRDNVLIITEIMMLEVRVYLKLCCKRLHISIGCVARGALPAAVL